MYSLKVVDKRHAVKDRPVYYISLAPTNVCVCVTDTASICLSQIPNVALLASSKHHDFVNPLV